MRLTETLLPGAFAVRSYADRILKGIPANQFARKPAIHGVLIELNHPAFGVGHLCLYPAELAKMLGVDPTPMAIPDNFGPLFRQNTQCLDDVSGEIYPPMGEIVSTFFRVTDALLVALPLVDEARFADKLEDPRRQERFGNVGAFVLYLLLAHQQVHLGQVMGWRKCMGLGAG